jgi:hypothetical protein
MHLEYSPKALMWQRLGPQYGSMGSGGTFKRGGLMRGLLAIEDMPLKMYWNTSPFILSFSCLSHELNSSAQPHAPCHYVLPHLRPKTKVANQPWAKKIVSQIRHFLSGN